MAIEECTCVKCKLSVGIDRDRPIGGEFLPCGCPMCLTCLLERWGEPEKHAAACYNKIVPPQESNMAWCPQCHVLFKLTWMERTDRQPITLIIRGCPSGGIYSVLTVCPHCRKETEL